MSDIGGDSSPKIAVVEFDDQQKANVAAALQRLADQMTPATIKQQPRDSDEIIELLSDSEAGNDTDSDCEIMGFLIENTGDSNERKEFDMSMVRPMLKQEIKDEITVPEPQIEINDTGAFAISASGDEMHKSVKWRETSFVNEVNINNGNETELVADGSSCSSSESRLQIVTEPQSADSNNIGIQQNRGTDGTDVTVESVMISLSNNVQSNHTHNLPTYITLTDITEDELQVKEVDMKNLAAPLTLVEDSQETLSANSEDMFNSYKVEPNVFKTDLMEMNNDATERYIIDLIDDDADSIYDSVDESDDEETKKIVIDLLESDDENEQGESSASFLKTRREGFACLIHYICPQCGVNCGKYSNYKTHTEMEHELGTMAALNLRTIIDKIGKLCYQCIECNEKLILKSPYIQLQAHRIKHLPHSDYLKCRLCEMRFSKKPSIRNHLKSTHAKIFRQYIKKKGPDPALKFVKIKCPICRSVQSNRKKWWKHLEENHDYVDKMTSQTTELGDGIYSCNLCRDMQIVRKLRKRSIRDHILTHEKYKSFKCTGCDTFKSYSILRAFIHIRIEHLNEKRQKRQYSCTYCDEIFDTSRLRYVHYRDHHKCTIQACAVCEKQFFSSSLLVSHMNYNNHYKLK